MARYLVTGGCGFIGSHLCDRLLRHDHSVVVLDNLSTGRLANLAPAAAFLQGDITDPDAVARAMDDIDGCFHLAAIASVPRSLEDWPGTHRVNLGGTVLILDEARRRQAAGRPCPVVLASSAAVYGDAALLPIRETAPTRPLSAYGADKLAGETHAAVGWTQFGLPATALRFFNVYGPRQDPSSPYSGVISIFLDRALRGLPIAIHGDGGQVRDFIFVGDVVAHLMRAMETCHEGARVFNVCSGQPTSIASLADLICRTVGRAVPITFLPPRDGDIRASLGSRAAVDRAFGHLGVRDLPAGLAHLVGSLALP